MITDQITKLPVQNSIKAIIFDLDGVIINSNPAIEAFWKTWADKESVVLTDAMISEWIYGRKVTDTLQGLFNHVSDNRKKEIVQSANEFDIHMKPGAIPGVIEFIVSIHSLRIPIGVVTSSHYPRMLTMLKNLGIDKNITHFVTATDVTQGKPDPEPYLKMREKMNIPNQACLVFEDAVSGIQSAIAANMQTIGIGDKKTRADLLLHGAADVVIDFTQIHVNAKKISIMNGRVFNIL